MWIPARFAKNIGQMRLRKEALKVLHCWFAINQLKTTVNEPIIV